MKKYLGFLGLVLIGMAVLMAPAVMANVAEAGRTVVEGAVEFPTGLVKLVGGVVWLIGEVLVLPFRAIF